MPDEPIDLSALDPDGDPGAEDRFVKSVMARIDTATAPASGAIDPLVGIWSIAGRFAFAASLIGLATIGLTVFRGDANESRVRAGPRSIPEAIGVPPEFLAVPRARSAP